MSYNSRTWKPLALPAHFGSPIGPFSPAAKADGFIFVSGQVPTDPRTSVLASDFETQSKQVLSNLRDALEAGGADLHDVISVRVYLADLANWPAFNEIYRRYFTPPYPSRTAIGAQLLGGFLVEVDAIAKIPDPSD